MATCVNPCASPEKKYLLLGTVRFDPTGPVEYNKVVNISVDVNDQSLLVGGQVYIDVVNISDGSCVYNEGFWLDRGTTRIVTFPIVMPNNDISLRISASSLAAPFYVTCEDIREFTIKQKYVMYDCVNKQCQLVKDGQYADAPSCVSSGCTPPATTVTYTCPGTGLACVPVTDGSGVSLAVCQSQGCKAPGGGAGCPSSQTNLFGLLGKCYPQNDVYIGLAGVALLFVMMKR